MHLGRLSCSGFFDFQNIKQMKLRLKKSGKLYSNMYYISSKCAVYSFTYSFGLNAPYSCKSHNKYHAAKNHKYSLVLFYMCTILKYVPNMVFHTYGFTMCKKGKSSLVVALPLC